MCIYCKLVDGDDIVLKDYPVSEKCTRTQADRMMERATATSPDRLVAVSFTVTCDHIIRT